MNLRPPLPPAKCPIFFQKILFLILLLSGCTAPDVMRYRDCQDLYRCQYHHYTADFKAETRVAGGKVRLDILGHTPKTDSEGDFLPQDLDANNAMIFTFTNLTDDPIELHVSQFEIRNNTIDEAYTSPYLLDEAFEVILNDRKPASFQIIDTQVTNYATKIKISFLVKSPAGREVKHLYAERVENRFNFFKKLFMASVWE